MAYDIETTKAPLNFPDQAIDQGIVSEGTEDFEYAPEGGYEGPFIIFNEPNKAATIMHFFSHVQDIKPTVMATFNCDRG
ncbi:hypothetical protein BT96DRAFT_1003933 [Gymnopus androsaceus JB14]|uniref:DNA polymerase epsilon catalytic subunit n=1 Tax=Gymnopus androsaceus JB14 TaxID=1447944 RepID=A0A6A4GUA5_9AGAR|nr:hypothetical protein BT96DRAFT_1008164 [Gymnopus androsaceus JB14]KAE9388717.1 hypothetical protein BT96DRAFT_1003933 [Gymnopus androsaceus JB14]